MLESRVSVLTNQSVRSHLFLMIRLTVSVRHLKLRWCPPTTRYRPAEILANCIVIHCVHLHPNVESTFSPRINLSRDLNYAHCIFCFGNHEPLKKKSKVIYSIVIINKSFQFGSSLMDYNDQIIHRTAITVPEGHRAPPDSTLAYVFFLYISGMTHHGWSIGWVHHLPITEIFIAVMWNLIHTFTIHHSIPFLLDKMLYLRKKYFFLHSIRDSIPQKFMFSFCPPERLAKAMS